MAQFRLMDHVRSRSMAAVPADLRNGVPEGVRLSGAPLLWAAGIDGKGVTIANIDTGVDAKHPDLRWCPDGRAKILSFRDYVKGDGWLQPGEAAYDDNGHGTHTAGTQAAWGEIQGVAPGTQLRVYKALDARGRGVDLTHISRAIRDAVTDGCRVISLSLGTDQPVPEWEEAINWAVDQGCLVNVAAGNDGPGSLLWPAYYSTVISVGAVAIDPDGNLATAWFSTTNPEVDLAADGQNVLSTMPGGLYAHMSGTSMACPHVAGEAALTVQLMEERLGEPATEPAVWQGLKSRSVPLGTREQSGAGFCTWYPTLPRRRTVQLKIGEAKRWVDGRMESLDVAPVLQDGRTLVPAKHTHEPLGDEVGWNGVTRAVTIARRVLDGMEV